MGEPSSERGASAPNANRKASIGGLGLLLDPSFSTPAPASTASLTAERLDGALTSLMDESRAQISPARSPSGAASLSRRSSLNPPSTPPRPSIIPPIDTSVLERETDDQDSGDYSSGSESSESEDESIPLEERFKQEQLKNKKFSETIANLLKQITQYKTVLEGEKEQLVKEKEEIEGRFQQEKANWREVVLQFEKQIENLTQALNQTVQEYETKLAEFEEEKRNRSNETIGNLQTLLKELTIIEEKNEELSKALLAEQQVHHNTQQKLDATTQLADTFERQCKLLEHEQSAMKAKLSMLRTPLKFSEKRFSLPQSPTSGSPVSGSPTNSSPLSSSSPHALSLEEIEKIETEKQQLQDHIEILTAQYNQAVIELEESKTKSQQVFELATQIKALAGSMDGREDASDSAEKGTLAKKLSEEKENTARLSALLEEERKKTSGDREYIESQGRRIKDLIASHQMTLKQVDTHREEVQEQKNIVKSLQREIRHLKEKEKKHNKKLLILGKSEGELMVPMEDSGSEDNTTGSNTPTGVSPRLVRTPSGILPELRRTNSVDKLKRSEVRGGSKIRKISSETTKNLSVSIADSEDAKSTTSNSEKLSPFTPSSPAVVDMQADVVKRLDLIPANSSPVSQAPSTSFTNTNAYATMGRRSSFSHELFNSLSQGIVSNLNYLETPQTLSGRSIRNHLKQMLKQNAEEADMETNSTGSSKNSEERSRHHRHKEKKEKKSRKDKLIESSRTRTGSFASFTTKERSSKVPPLATELAASGGARERAPSQGGTPIKQPDMGKMQAEFAAANARERLKRQDVGHISPLLTSRERSATTLTPAEDHQDGSHTAREGRRGSISAVLEEWGRRKSSDSRSSSDGLQTPRTRYSTEKKAQMDKERKAEEEKQKKKEAEEEKKRKKEEEKRLKEEKKKQKEKDKKKPQDKEEKSKEASDVAAEEDPSNPKTSGEDVEQARLRALFGGGGTNRENRKSRIMFDLSSKWSRVVGGKDKEGEGT